MNRSIRRPAHTVQNLRQRMILETEAFLNRELRRAPRPLADLPDTISAAEVKAARDLPEPLFVVFVSPWSDELRELLVTSGGLTLALPQCERTAEAAESQESASAAAPHAKGLAAAEMETPHWPEFARASYAQVS